MEIGTNFDTELFGMKRADALFIPAPKLIASGIVNDKYQFQYMVMEYIEASALGDIEEKQSFDEKVVIGRKPREITDRLNTPCDNFDPVDVLQNAVKNGGWSDYPDSFKVMRERLHEMIKSGKEKMQLCSSECRR